MAGITFPFSPLLLSRHSRAPAASAALRPLRRLRRSPGRLRSPPPPRSSSSPPRSSGPPNTKYKAEAAGVREAAAVTPLRSASRFLERIRTDGISLEIVGIALPAVLALAADPVASLVDTAFVGHLGAVELAAIGVSVSVFNLVSKLFNVPLLNITTSFVAEEQALDSKMRSDKGLGSETVQQEFIGHGDTEGRKFLPAVSASLVLATLIGIAEAVALSWGSGHLLNFIGISVDSPMRIPAEQFLIMRAYGAPPIVVALAAQGAFRGFVDTKTPLYAVGAGNFLNAILDPILIFCLGLGIAGAAVATVISEYMIAFFLLWKLSEKVILVPPNMLMTGVGRYIKSGGLLICRTIAVLLTMTLSTSLAAREGALPMAGHQICLQVWLSVSLLNDALALAGQALLAKEYTRGNYYQARLIIYRILQIGAVTGISLAIVLFFGFGTFSTIFTTDFAVLNIAQSGLLFVTVSQPVNALAFVFDGLYYGVSDFAFAAYSMVLVSLISSLFLLMVAPAFGLAGVWMGLFLFMCLRTIAGFWRLRTKGGPWKLVWSEMAEGMKEK